VQDPLKVLSSEKDPSEIRFIRNLAICFQTANSCTRWRCNFKGLAQQEGRADFYKNLRTTLINAVLRIQIRIHTKMS
jgi:hypothetical protein